jgi:FRG domain
MPIREIHVRSFRGLLTGLEGFALGSNRDEYVYRGHSSTSWRLTSTFARHVTTTPRFHGAAIEQLVSRFVHGLASIGNRELIGKDRRTRLEFARHHGVPSPLIDVTRSPFIALWFAFNGVRGTVDRGK